MDEDVVPSERPGSGHAALLPGRPPALAETSVRAGPLDPPPDPQSPQPETPLVERSVSFGRRSHVAGRHISLLPMDACRSERRRLITVTAIIMPLPFMC